MSIEYTKLYPIKNYEKLYSITKNGRIWLHRRNKWLIPQMNRGYYCVILYKNGKHKLKLIHRLVAIAFIPNPKNKPQINHKNGIKTDNRISNLEWCTQKENMTHAIKMGLINNNGENNPNTKLIWKQVDEMRNNHLQEYQKTGDKPWNKYGIANNTYFNIINNITWKNSNYKPTRNKIVYI